MPRNNIQHSINQIDWTFIENELNDYGYATTSPLLTTAQCNALIGMFANDCLFRSRIDMSRYKFGEGEYKYFAEPLPETVAGIREFIYPRLATIANRWNERLGNPKIFP